MNEDTLLPNAEQPLIWINPGRVSGAPCFYKTRLPVSSLVENLEGGVSLDEWLDAFPPITREQALAVLEYLRGPGRHLLNSGKKEKPGGPIKPARKHEKHRTFGSQTLAEADAASEDQGWQEFREQCRRQMRRPMEQRIKYGFCRMYKPVLDDAPSRVFNTMAEYRAWCAEKLPDYLGFKPAAK